MTRRWPRPGGPKRRNRSSILGAILRCRQCASGFDLAGGALGRVGGDRLQGRHPILEPGHQITQAFVLLVDRLALAPEMQARCASMRATSCAFLALSRPRHIRAYEVVRFIERKAMQAVP